MSAPTTMLARAEAYLVERRRLGFVLDRPGSATLAFARFADANGHEGPLNSTIVLHWAKEQAKHADPFTWAQRLNILRPFAHFLSDIEPGTTFPTGSPFGRSKRRLAPHIFTPIEVEAIVVAARTLQPVLGAIPATFPTLFGLLAATGLRISEALSLCCGDLDDAITQITVKQSKFNRTRIVPLHSTVTVALQNYRRKRAKFGPTYPFAPFFLDGHDGKGLSYGTVRRAWIRLTTDLGIVPRGDYRFIRIHDLRHTFICQRLLLWQAAGSDLDNAMLALSTYVGHLNLGDTYWYLQGVPELLAVAGDRFRAHTSHWGERDD